MHDPRHPDDLYDERVTHLVFVDGRLVETWHDSAFGSPWQQHAERHDRERLRPPPPPPDPPYAQVLRWLTRACGSPEALDALTSAPLTGQEPALPEVAEQSARDRLTAVADLLDAVAARVFAPELAGEMTVALRRALLLVWQEDPDVVTGARSAAHVAGGVCWAVGKANGCFAPVGPVRMGRLQDALGHSVSPAAWGQRVRTALWGYRSLVAGDLGRWRPADVPDLMDLGHSELLLGSTRASLLALRDRARMAQAAA